MIRSLHGVFAALCFLAHAGAFAQGALTSCANIMPLGDSITAGTNGGYRNQLYTQPLDAKCGVSFVGTQYDINARVEDKDHEGHPSFTIGDIAREVNSWLAATQPSIVILMIGTNDLAWWSAESPEARARRHDALVGQILDARNGVWVFVASVPPQTSEAVQPNNWDRATLAAEFNVFVRMNAEARQTAGQRVRFVDTYSAITVADLQSDGIHPTDAGYDKIGVRLAEGIRAALGSNPTPPATSPPPPSPAPPPAPPS